MRVEIRGQGSSDVCARVDRALLEGEVQRDGDELRVGLAAGGGDALRAAAAAAARSLRRTGGTVAWSIDDSLGLTADEQVRALVEGSSFGAYDPGLYKSGYATRPELTLALDVLDDLRDLVERQATIARHLDAARDLSNRSPNDLTPPVLAEHAKSLAGGHLTVSSFGRDWIEAQGMGAFAAVAQSSAEDPQLIVMRYEPPAAAADVTLGLVGKAITFDSGGISLKPPLRMQDMKGDMAGGAAVISATAAIAELGLPVRLLTVVA